MLVHQFTHESVRVSMVVEADGSWRISFVGGTNRENLGASMLARNYLIANGITRGGYVKWGQKREQAKWLVNEWGVARLYRELHVYPQVAAVAA